MSSPPKFSILPLLLPTFDRTEIDIGEIRRLSELGLDEDEKEDRAFAWLAMLGIYPKDPLGWKSAQTDILKSYWGFVREVGLENWQTKEIPNQVSREYFSLQNSSLMALIHGDIVRTGRHLFFFPPSPIPDSTCHDTEDMIFQFATHARRLERILYVFGCLNPGLGYMQGYNELVCPLYYVLLMAGKAFSNDFSMIEALSFQCLQTLLTESTLHELYTTVDKSSIILHKLNEFSVLLKRHMPKSYDIIDSLQIHPLLYCYRWFNLMFCQEHDMPEILVLWDALLAHFSELVEYVFYVGLGHVKMVESKLTETNYGETLSSLQNLTDMDVKAILVYSKSCWDKDHGFHSKLSDFFSGHKK